MKRPVRNMRGKGKLGDLLRKGNAFLKKTQVVSRTLDNMASGPKGNNIMWLKPVAALAKSYGYGAPLRRTTTSRARRRVRGAGAGGDFLKKMGGIIQQRGAQRSLRGKGKIMDWIKNKALPWLKKTKIISTVGNALAPIPGIGSIAGTVGKVAGAAGYGMRRRARRTTKKRMVRGRGRTAERAAYPNPQSGIGYAGTNTYSSSNVGFGRRAALCSRRKMRGRGMIGNTGQSISYGTNNVPYSAVGIPGRASYSSANVKF
jgi:hypothetical protein